MVCIRLYTPEEVEVVQLPLKLSQASGVPYYRQIVDQVTELIRSGQLPPAARLPSVRELASQLLVSLITVRRAYGDLEHARLIVLRQGYGTFVADEVDSASHEQALAEAREALDEAISRARRLGVDLQTIRAILDELLAQEEAGDANP
jgi:GntR family transcriptional regulator